MKRAAYILIVEEREPFRSFILNAVQTAGYETISAATVDEVNGLSHPFIAALIAMDAGENTENIIDTLLTRSIPTILLKGTEPESVTAHLVSKNIAEYVDLQNQDYCQSIVLLINRIEKNSGKQILVVDDSKTYRNYIAGMLAGSNFTALEAENGRKALEMLEVNNDIEMVITDYEMSETTGLDLIKHIRQKSDMYQMPIIVISHNYAKDVIVGCLRSGANDYLHKPIEREELFGRIYKTLDYKENLEVLAAQTRLLEEYKETLEHCVIAEVNKNQAQSAHMIAQSRFATMGEMLSMISHQWRQPLASISAISSTLSVDVMMDEYNKEFFEDRLMAIEELAQHLSATINDFRAFLKTNKEKTVSTWEDIAEGSLKLIEPVLSAHRITVERIYENSNEFPAYVNEIRQVLLNIFKNAEDILVEKEIENGMIWLRSYEKEGMACLSIEDNAGGIPEEVMEKIFDPYFSTKEKIDGTGLGLYMSKTIIEEHCKGELGAYNTEHGALFEIRIPK